MANYFTGRYYKHQKNGNTICFIIGHTADTEFVQILTTYDVIQYDSLNGVKISRSELRIDYPEVQGCVRYGKLLPLHSHIMGPFHFLPMQCNHEVISMRHTIQGSFKVHGKRIDLNDGIGYIEGDYGRSFPKEYLWLHCNDFSDDLSVMVSVADIPFCGIHFTGCICAITFRGKEYRLATYYGVRIHAANEKKVILTQGKYRLDILISNADSYPLRSPINGKMINTIHESSCPKAKFRFTERDEVIFQTMSTHCSFECNIDINR